MSGVVEQRLRVLMLSVLHDMGKLTRETPIEEFRRVNGAWRRLRYEAKGIGTAAEPGEAQAFIESIHSDPAFRNFDRIRAWHAKQTDAYKAKKKASDHAYYLTKTKPKRQAAKGAA